MGMVVPYIMENKPDGVYYPWDSTTMISEWVFPDHHVEKPKPRTNARRC